MTRDEVMTRLPDFLKEHNMTQRQLADMLDVSRCLVGHWICGRRKPSYEKYERLVELMEDERGSICE